MLNRVHLDRLLQFWPSELDLWPLNFWSNIHLWARYRDGLSMCQVLAVLVLSWGQTDRQTESHTDADDRLTYGTTILIQPKSVGLVWRSAANWRCPSFVKWAEWTLAVTLSRWQNYKDRPGIIIIIITTIIITVSVGNSVTYLQPAITITIMIRCYTHADVKNWWLASLVQPTARDLSLEKLDAACLLDRLKTHAGHSIAWNMFCPLWPPVTLTFHLLT